MMGPMMECWNRGSHTCTQLWHLSPGVASRPSTDPPRCCRTTMPARNPENLRRHLVTPHVGDVAEPIVSIKTEPTSRKPRGVVDAMNNVEGKLKESSLRSSRRWVCVCKRMWKFEPFCWDALHWGRRHGVRSWHIQGEKSCFLKILTRLKYNRVSPGPSVTSGNRKAHFS